MKTIPSSEKKLKFVYFLFIFFSAPDCVRGPLEHCSVDMAVQASKTGMVIVLSTAFQLIYDCWRKVVKVVVDAITTKSTKIGDDRALGNEVTSKRIENARCKGEQFR